MSFLKNYLLKNLFCLMAVCLFLYPMLLQAQNKARKDSLKAAKDTTVTQTDEETGSLESASDTTKSLVEQVQDLSKKDTFWARILKNMLINEDEESNRNHEKIESINRKYTGKFIRNINIDVLNVFGTSVDHPHDTASNWIQSVGNAIHINTKEWLIRDKLIFYRGDPLIPFDLQESERILRQSPYIYDARIVARGIKNNPDSVDVMVYVQDIWSITGGGSYQPEDKTGSLHFTDANFLGFGSELSGGLKFDNYYSRGWDWDGSYVINNIDRTYFSGRLYYQTDRFRQNYGVGINRDFFSPVISWAGGMSFQWQNERQSLLRDTLLLIGNARFNTQDYWLGYAFDVKPFDPTTVNQNRFNIAARISHTAYSARPDFDTMHIFQDNTFYLARLGFSLKSYYQDKYIFGLGKTEDIPLGSMVEFLFGYDDGQYVKRPYLGFRAAHSLYNDNFGYLYGSIQSGAYRYNDVWINGTYLVDFVYFSKLLPIGSYRWRHYIESRYSHSYDPITRLDLLDLNNDNGLRGFTDDYLKGNKKLTLNYESDIFIPLKFLGFKLALITFADLALLAPTDNLLFQSKLYQGYGIGFRIRNEHLIFPTFQLMIGYYPNTPEPGGGRFNLFKQTTMFYQLNQFQFSTPSVIEF